MRKMRILTLLATSAALAIAVGGSASAQAIVDEGVTTPDEVVVVIDDGVTIPDEVVVVDDGVIPDEVVVEDKVLVEEVALGGGRDLDGVIAPEERNLDGDENPDVIFYTMGGGEDFGGGAADKAAEQATDRALERIDAAAPASARPISTDKN